MKDMNTRRRPALLVIAMALIAASCATDKASESQADKASNADSQEEAAPATLADATVDDDCAMLTQALTVDLVAGDTWFGPECFTMKANAKLRIRNVGEKIHNFAISEGEFRTSPWAVEIGDLETGQLTMTSKKPLGDYLEPGVYEFFCLRHAGMDGVLELVEPIL
jgi:plastocyanin